MKSASIWKSMSSASGLLRQWPLSGRQAAQHVVASHLVGVPQHVLGVGERFPERRGGRVESVLLDDIDERQVDVHVVVQARITFVRLPQVAGIPRDRFVVLDERTVVVEFGGAAESDTDGLRGPSTTNLVAEHGLGQPQLGPRIRPPLRAGAARHDNRRTQQGQHHRGLHLHAGILLKNAEMPGMPKCWDAHDDVKWHRRRASGCKTSRVRRACI